MALELRVEFAIGIGAPEHIAEPDECGAKALHG
jgi:hypothetical protein